MTEESELRTSRRAVLWTTVAALAAVAIPPRAGAQTKIAQKLVQYQQKPKGAQECDNCLHFVPPASCKINSAARREATSAISGSAPRPNRVDASVCSFIDRAERRIAIGSNHAHSISTFFVENEISVSAPPMIPPTP